MANYIKNIPSSLANTTADLLANSDFINRSVGMANSYEDIMFIVQALGREPVSLLGKDYLYIFDHVRRNYNIGSNVMDVYHNDCPKFTFYKEKPTVRFANPYEDPMNYLGNWSPNANFEKTSVLMSGRGTLYSYAESDDGDTENKEIGTFSDNENANAGVFFGGISSFANSLSTCDLIKKTNDNFNHGKYRTLIARFHTKEMASRDKDDITQTAYSEGYGMSHGRNLLSTVVENNNGYDNPYCRVWTYHHQYNQLARAIRPFMNEGEEGVTKSGLEALELLGTNGDEYDTVGFRTKRNEKYGFGSGSERLDSHGVLNYKNGMVNIAPTAKIKDYFEHKEDYEKAVSLKKCMFSIENLAWKSDNIIHDEYDQLGLSPEQKGPLGGRIMWFPPYDIKFGEQVQVNWNSNQFIGRGEKVYTYTDTERTGNLSFTMVIDHPAILDYWTGHERNGMSNLGKKLIPNNAGGIDEVDNQENTLLRFFAGCDILTAKPQEFRKRNRKPSDEKKIEHINDTVPNTDINPGTSKGKTIHCVLYFPNNYSGVDDQPTKASKVNSIYYLVNGIGTQMCINEKTLSVESIPSQIDEKINGGHLGGYEINNVGISVATKNLTPIVNVLDKTLKTDNGEYLKEGEYLTDEYGDKIEVEVGEGQNKKYKLAKIVGPNAKSIKDINSVPTNWFYERWYYRVDNAYKDDDLTHEQSYLDTTCECLNSTGYTKIRSEKDVMNFFGLDEADKDTTLISFADLFVALEGEKAENLLSGFYDSSVVDRIREIKRNKDKYKFTLKFDGHASQAGDNTSNDTLSKNRANTLRNWMKKMGFPGIDNETQSNGERNPENSIKNQGKNNELYTKLWRSASVIITYEEIDIDYASTADSSTVQHDVNDTSEATSGNTLNQLEKLTIDNGKESKEIRQPSNLSNEKKEKEGWIETNQKPWWSFAEELSWKIKGQNDGKNYFDEMSWDFDNSYRRNETGITGVSKGVVERYDNEGEFFQLLETKDPFMHHLITDKIKYFDPAYHSISPEGFNARLTFLHQCTRQGSTVGASDNAPGTAYNLAFGRPPICVLRLGDFYNTKIVITRVGIEYEDSKWDLNPEGIGVMPMFAKIDLQFVFLGGSDLAGPISRLQNAVSFNYYANTSVYDNRAEMVEYDENGKGHEKHFKPYSYPDMVERNNGDPRKRASVAVNEVIATEFNGRTTNINQGVNGEKTGYYGKMDKNGNISRL